MNNVECAACWAALMRFALQPLLSAAQFALLFVETALPPEAGDYYLKRGKFYGFDA